MGYHAHKSCLVACRGVVLKALIPAIGCPSLEREGDRMRKKRIKLTFE
jgi:hypothetical protein